MMTVQNEHRYARRPAGGEGEGAEAPPAKRSRLGPLGASPAQPSKRGAVGKGKAAGAAARELSPEAPAATGGAVVPKEGLAAVAPGEQPGEEPIEEPASVEKRPAAARGMKESQEMPGWVVQSASKLKQGPGVAAIAPPGSTAAKVCLEGGLPIA